MSREHVYTLPTGRLQLTLESGPWPADALFAVGARDNPKRGFLFVSKVLGKHWPVTPATLAQTHQALAALLPPPHAGPTLFVGMAETATGLAQGVFEAWLAQHSGQAALYLHTSRLRVADADICPFEESHSHAAQQWLHLPRNPALRQRFQAARQLVLIDDELSTGNTFRQLAAALHPYLPHWQQTHWLSLTDFSPPGTDDAVQRHSLLQGRWQFAPTPRPATAAAAQGRPVTVVDSGFGRLGIDRALVFDAASLPQDIAAHEKILVLGVGEFIHPPSVWARQLQASSGAAVWLQSTTRSPALLWGALQHKRQWPDPYGEGVPNYLYNVADGQYDRIYLCHEHPATAALEHCAADLGATLIHLSA